VRSAGLFLQGDLTLPGGAVVLAGIRYDNHRFEAEDRIPVSASNPDDSGVRTMDAVSPSIGASVPLGDRFNLFGSVGTVFETPTTTELANQPTAAGGFNPELDPMSGRSFELGLRGRPASLIAFEVTAYQTDLDNELVPFEVAGQEGVTFFRNSGSSRHRGLEATLSAASRGGLARGDFTWTRTDARYQDYVLEGEDLADNRVPGVAPNRAQALLRVSPSPWFGEVVLGWVDEVHVNDQNTASAPSYTLLDLRSGLSEVRLGGLEVSPWVAVTNVLDEAYIASVVVNSTNPRVFEPGPERGLQLGLRARWARE
jgi:iron complex outermembrane receptor protein